MNDYNIALNPLKALIYFHLAKLDSLRDIDDFMQSDSKLKESIRSKITYSDEMLLDDSINIIEDTICYLGQDGYVVNNNLLTTYLYIIYSQGIN